MLDNQEMPIGFTMELAQHSDALIRFSQLPKEKQIQVAQKAASINTREQMRQFVTGGGEF